MSILQKIIAFIRSILDIWFPQKSKVDTNEIKKKQADKKANEKKEYDNLDEDEKRDADIDYWNRP